MENHHAINGKIHYFDWAIFNSYVKLPEARWFWPHHGLFPFKLPNYHGSWRYHDEPMEWRRSSSWGVWNFCVPACCTSSLERTWPSSTCSLQMDVHHISTLNAFHYRWCTLEITTDGKAPWNPKDQRISDLSTDRWPRWPKTGRFISAVPLRLPEPLLRLALQGRPEFQGALGERQSFGATDVTNW